MGTRIIFSVFLILPVVLGCDLLKNCQVSPRSEITHGYPKDTPNGQYDYFINFNKTIMQANYVWYISTSGGNRYPSCPSIRMDPYDINTLRTKDYTNTGYDRGHLVPNADYGYSTCIMSNVVPMIPKFNQGIWAKSERYIRDNFAGKLVYKGCDYDETYITTVTDKKLYIPVGCYYAIFSDKTIMDYGYYYNNADPQEKICKLPYWINCENVFTDHDNKPDFVQMIVAISLVCIIIIVLCTFALVCRIIMHRRPKENVKSEELPYEL
jgi:DNA/RNA endonuclease G (NUC1)